MKHIMCINTGGTFSSKAISTSEDHETVSIELTMSSIAVQDYITREFQSKYTSFAGLPPVDISSGDVVALKWVNAGVYKLSEEMQLSDWLKIANTIVEYLRECSQVDCLGIIVIHGTDTMDVAAPMLHSLTFPIDVPVVLVGANRPMLINEVAETRPSDTRSDAWGNLLTAAMFIITVSEQIAGVYLCFGDSILHPINIEKRSRSKAYRPERSPFNAALQSADSAVPAVASGYGALEDFIFKNKLTGCDSFARLLHGRFVCHKPRVSKESLISYIHEINNKWCSYNEMPSTVVCELRASSMPSIYSSEHLPENHKPMVVLYHTFPSGSIPLNPEHPCGNLIRKIKGYPIFLAAPDGITHDSIYQLNVINELQDVSLYYFRDCIPQTAYALLATAVSRLDDKILYLCQQGHADRARSDLIGSMVVDFINGHHDRIWSVTPIDKKAVRKLGEG